MSNLNAVRTELRLKEEQKPEPSHLGTVAAVALLILAVSCGLAELHLLPSFSADDFSSIVFAAG